VTTTGNKRPDYLGQAEQFCRNQQFDQAIELVRSQIDRSGPDPAGRFVLARALHGAGKDDEALAELKTLAEKVAKNLAVWRLIGRIHFENGRREQASEALNRALELRPNDVYSGRISEVIAGTTDKFEGLGSETIADLYLEQGHRTTAIKMLSWLAVENPANRQVAKKLSRAIAGEV
jgi:predicted Zn-dependent protease